MGATEYRYDEDFNVAMTDFTIIGQHGLGIGPFLAQKRLADLQTLAAENGKTLAGMFAEIYDPYQVENYEFGGVKPMDPFVRREVLSHLGYKRLDFTYVHPSWNNDGEAVTGLDLGFLPMTERSDVETDLIVSFLKRYCAFKQTSKMGSNDRKFEGKRKSRLTSIIMNKKSSFDDEDFFVLKRVIDIITFTSSRLIKTMQLVARYERLIIPCRRAVSRRPEIP